MLILLNLHISYKIIILKDFLKIKMGIIIVYKNYSTGEFKIRSTCSENIPQVNSNTDWKIVEMYSKVVDACHIGNLVKEQVEKLVTITEEDVKKIIDIIIEKEELKYDVKRALKRLSEFTNKLNMNNMYSTTTTLEPSLNSPSVLESPNEVLNDPGINNNKKRKREIDEPTTPTKTTNWMRTPSAPKKLKIIKKRPLNMVTKITPPPIETNSRDVLQGTSSKQTILIPTPQYPQYSQYSQYPQYMEYPSVPYRYYPYWGLNYPYVDSEQGSLPFHIKTTASVNSQQQNLTMLANIASTCAKK